MFGTWTVQLLLACMLIHSYELFVMVLPGLDAVLHTGIQRGILGLLWKQSGDYQVASQLS